MPRKNMPHDKHLKKPGFIYRKPDRVKDSGYFLTSYTDIPKQKFRARFKMSRSVYQDVDKVIKEYL